MFSTGQIVFAVSFILGFSTLLYLMYQKDRSWHKKYYKGSYWVLISFVCFIIILVTLKYILKK